MNSRRVEEQRKRRQGANDEGAVLGGHSSSEIAAESSIEEGKCAQESAEPNRIGREKDTMQLSGPVTSSTSAVLCIMSFHCLRISTFAKTLTSQPPTNLLKLLRASSSHGSCWREELVAFIK
jgi:hypothetical protein